jgi:hypothetical protein
MRLKHSGFFEQNASHRTQCGTRNQSKNPRAYAFVENSLDPPLARENPRARISLHLDAIADLDHFTHGFVAEHVTGFHVGNEAAHEMKV